MLLLFWNEPPPVSTLLQVHKSLLQQRLRVPLWKNMFFSEWLACNMRTRGRCVALNSAPLDMHVFAQITDFCTSACCSWSPMLRLGKLEFDEFGGPSLYSRDSSSP